MKKIVLVFIFMLGFAWNCHAQTWTYMQDSIVTFCTSPNVSGCTFDNGTFVTSTAGTILVLQVHTPNNVTISSVTDNAGDTWQLCPSSKCHLYNAANADSGDLAYTLTGKGNASSITVNLSGSSGSYLGVELYEIMPPVGATPAFDDAGTTTSSTCTTCAGPALNVTGTDAVLQILSNNGPASWQVWSSPYITDIFGNGWGLNVSSGAAPTAKVQNAGADIIGIAFKSSLSFTPPATPISLVNFTIAQTLNCNSSCSITIPSTGSGNLLYIEAADLTSNFISSISGGGTWVIPSSANTCRISLSPGDALSCAYVLSSTSGTTSLSVTMTGTANASFAVAELASSSGPFSLDVQGSTTNAPSLNPKGQALTLTGGEDAIFQAIFQPGGTSGDTRYPLATTASTSSINFMNNSAGMAMLLNTANGAPPSWVNQQNNTTTVTGVAFKVGTATAVAPPTSLKAVVN